MGIFEGAILLCDIDGTLLENGVIPQRNIDKINYFIKEGGNFSIATGRNLAGFSNVINTFPNISPSVVSNGCIIYDYKAEKILYERVLDKNDYHFAKDVLKSEIICGIEIHSGERVFTLSRTTETDDHQRDQQLETTEIIFEDASKIKWNKVVYLLNSADDYELINKIINSEGSNSNFLKVCTFIDGTRRNYLEQTLLNTTKQVAIEKLCEILKIEAGKRFAIGDYYNDLTMLINADISATTAEAPDEIKQEADFVAGSCKNGAVADFIDYLTEIFTN